MPGRVDLVTAGAQAACFRTLPVLLSYFCLLVYPIYDDVYRASLW